MHIVLAEDDSFLTKVYGSLLKETGYEVTIVRDGDAALKAMNKRKTDLLLLDILMPKKDGFDVLKEMKESKKLKSIPVIVLSSLEQESDVKTAMELGAKDYFTKSDTEIETLISKVKKILPSTK